MVALNPAYASSESIDAPQNRVGDFFCRSSDRVGVNRLSIQQPRLESELTFTITASGRPFFINADPIGFEGGSNWYQYAAGNPISYVDPEGTFIWHAIGALVGGGLDLGVQLYLNDGDFSEVNWTSVGVSSASGAAGVGLGANVARLTTSVAARAAVNGVGSAAIGATGQVVNNVSRGADWNKDIGKAATINGILGAAGSASGDFVEIGIGKAVNSLAKQNSVVDGLIQSGFLKAGSNGPYLLPGETLPPSLGSQVGTATGIISSNLGPLFGNK